MRAGSVPSEALWADVAVIFGSASWRFSQPRYAPSFPPLASQNEALIALFAAISAPSPSCGCIGSQARLLIPRGNPDTVFGMTALGGALPHGKARALLGLPRRGSITAFSLPCCRLACLRSACWGSLRGLVPRWARRAHEAGNEGRQHGEERAGACAHGATDGGKVLRPARRNVCVAHPPGKERPVFRGDGARAFASTAEAMVREHKVRDESAAAKGGGI